MHKYPGFLSDISRFFGHKIDIVIFEIGVGCTGHSTGAFLRGLSLRKNGTLYSVDIRDYKNSVPNQLKKKWVFIHGDSQNIEWNKEIDILFIDGNHTYEAVKADYERYEPFVKSKGLILMHDVTNKNWGVKDFWKEIKYSKVILQLDAAGMGIINKL